MWQLYPHEDSKSPYTRGPWATVWFLSRQFEASPSAVQAVVVMPCRRCPVGACTDRCRPAPHPGARLRIGQDCRSRVRVITREVLMEVLGKPLPF